MDREAVKCKCGFYSYRVYAKKRDPHGVIWDAYYDIIDQDWPCTERRECRHDSRYPYQRRGGLPSSGS